MWKMSVFRILIKILWIFFSIPTFHLLHPFIYSSLTMFENFFSRKQYNLTKLVKNCRLVFIKKPKLRWIKEISIQFIITPFGWTDA